MADGELESQKQTVVGHLVDKESGFGKPSGVGNIPIADGELEGNKQADEADGGDG